MIFLIPNMDGQVKYEQDWNQEEQLIENRREK